MADFDKLAALRARANKAKNKANNRVTSEQLFGIITEFLNDDNSTFTTVENTYLATNPTKSLSSIKAAFVKVIRENDLDELVYAVEMEGHVYLTMLADEENEDTPSS